MRANDIMDGKHKTTVQIRFADMDAMGHVNNAKFLTYMESARVKYFNELLGQDINWSKKGIILAKVIVEYKAPLTLRDGELEIYTNCCKTGKKSFDLAYKMISAKDKRVVASGMTTLVCYDYERGATIELPAEWKGKMI